MSKRNKRKKLSSCISLVEQLETRRLLATINVADFGARPNDGVDDTGAIRAAINASKPGDTIVFTGGRFDVKDMIQLKSDRTYTGGGTLYRKPGEGFIFSTDGSNSNIRINNLTLEGGGLNGGNGMARGMVITDTTFKNITRGWPTGNAILLTAGAENSKFNNNTFVNIMGENAIYGFNRFHNVEISNNYFDTVQEGVHLAYDNGGDNLQIKNNTFIRVHRMAIELQGRGATNTLIEGNKASEWNDPYHGSFFLSITNLARGVTVRNNHAASGKFGQIDPRAKDTPVGMEISGWDVLVENNVIEGFREGSHLMNIRNAVVRNNKFYNQTWMAIWRTGINKDDFNGTNITIENNEIYNPKTTAFLFHGRSTGTIRNNQIYLFGDAKEYTEGNGGALSNMSRPGNQVQRMSGSPKPYTGQSPITGNPGGGGSVAWPPSAPSGLKAVAKAPTQIDVTWTDNAKDEKGFRLYRRENGGGDWQLIAHLGANVQMYKDGAVEPGKDYSYRALAYNDNGFSGYSNEHNATTPATGGGNNDSGKPVDPPPVNNPAPATPPTAPTGLHVTARSSNQIDVTWTDTSDNEAGFKLYRRDNNGGSWQLIATLDAGATTYKDGTAEAGRNYSYKVLAYNNAGVSAWSNEHNAITAAADQPQPVPQEPAVTPPAAPTGVQVAAKHARRVDVTWMDMSDNETGFKLYRRDNNGGDEHAWELIATLDADATFYIDGGAQAGMHYSYKLVSFNAAGVSSWSNEHDAKTSQLDAGPIQPGPVQAPPAPTNFQARLLNPKVIETRWEGLVEGVRGIKLYRREGNGEWVFIAQMDGAADTYKDGAIEAGKVYTYRVVQFTHLHSTYSSPSTLAA